jgi:capsular exopolysaccharide synthesis family protein
MVLASAAGEEGKGFLAANLAAGLASEGKKVLLVDGDLRAPSLHAFFGLDNQRGWGGRIGGQAPLLQDLSQATQVAGLRLVAAGPTPENIGRQVESPAVGELLAQARQEYDHILWLGPPLLNVSDALIFGEHLKGLLLVVQACKAGRQEVGQALELARTARLDLLGVALTF